MLLVAGLVAAQAATLAIALLLPARPSPAFRLAQIADALRGGPLPVAEGRPLVRSTAPQPPEDAASGWISLERARRDLARMLGAPEADVRVQFFVPLPFAGAPQTTAPGPPQGMRFARSASPGPAPGPALPEPPDGGMDGAFHGPPPDGPWAPPPSSPPGDGPPAWAPPPFPPAQVWRGHGGPHWGPYVDGDFVAALRTGAGRWTVVRPTPARFPTPRERRLILWFGLSFAVIAPVGYLFARRLVAPLAAFAAAAERLGRDPRAPLLALEGPAEIGRAARALNDMQVRLQRYVEDRTGMIGAISHDLRTPLARLKFKLERVAPEDRASMLGDVEQMEAMITSVLTFIRDAAEPTQRDRTDLRSVLECAIDEAAIMGAAATLDAGEAVLVEVDAFAIKRVIDNLVDNAVKYGGEAEARLWVDEGEAVVEIADRGPGLAPEDLDRVFTPFYRSTPSRNLDVGGVGLGLSISRSIARAHGGEVRLRPAERGLVAELRLPLACPA